MAPVWGERVGLGLLQSKSMDRVLPRGPRSVRPCVCCVCLLGLWGSVSGYLHVCVCTHISVPCVSVGPIRTGIDQGIPVSVRPYASTSQASSCVILRQFCGVGAIVPILQRWRLRLGEVKLDSL